MEQDRIYMKGELIGPYEVARIISAGGMSIVYEALPGPEEREDLLSMGFERVALKMVRLDARRLGPHELRMLVQRITREFETLYGLMKLGHPNIVDVLDWGFEDSVPYYVMEIVPPARSWSRDESAAR
jgi:serine/threonine protein kinase